MKKIYVLAPEENWICDRMAAEYVDHNRGRSVLNPHDADLIWLMSDWCFNRLPKDLLKKKKVVTTIHHIVPDKFIKNNEIFTFKMRDEITDAYHVPNNHTREFIQHLTKKPVYIIPYWANTAIWFRGSNGEHEFFDHEKTRHHTRYQINAREDDYVVFSAQRDTEGADLISPKLEKGPDLLADYLEHLNKEKKLFVLLAGWRRQYLISRLEKAKIRYRYEELPQQERLNELYQAADLYPVTARYEGGPQSFIECALTNVPMVSRHVGMAEMMLPLSAIHDDVSQAIPSIPKLLPKQTIPECFNEYNKLFDNL